MGAPNIQTALLQVAVLWRLWQGLQGLLHSRVNRPWQACVTIASAHCAQCLLHSSALCSAMRGLLSNANLHMLPYIHHLLPGAIVLQA